jgi:hypothetical protein
MRRTDFWARMDRVFGAAYAPSVARDQMLSELDGRSVEQALAEGEDTKRVWLAVCTHFGLPAAERAAPS